MKVMELQAMTILDGNQTKKLGSFESSFFMQFCELYKIVSEHGLYGKIVKM